MTRQNTLTFRNNSKNDVLEAFAPPELLEIDHNQRTIPKLAKDRRKTLMIEKILSTLPTYHEFYQADARSINFLPPESIHLVITSPPYWTLKEYRKNSKQLGAIPDYHCFLNELKKVWSICYRVLVPGGRLVCVVGDVCLSRRKNKGRHAVIPLHASIQEQCQNIGFDNLAPIIWYKIANAKLESNGSAGFLGKPYEPNGIIKNDIEFILMQRKPGGYRKADSLERLFSVIPTENHKQWFQQIWSNINGASTKNHPAPYPQRLAERLIRMFSFVGDVILDPFSGSGTTAIAAADCGRNSINVEIDDVYFSESVKRLRCQTNTLLHSTEIIDHSRNVNYVT